MWCRESGTRNLGRAVPEAGRFNHKEGRPGLGESVTDRIYHRKMGSRISMTLEDKVKMLQLVPV